MMELPVDTVKARLIDKNGPCISWSDIRDAMGKASGDRHLALFVFAIYGLIVFPKALGYLFIWMKSNFRCLYKHFRQVFAPSTRPIEEFLESEWPPNQLIKEWVQNLSTLTYQEIEWRAPWMIQSTVDPSLRANKFQKAGEQERTWRKVSNEKTAEIEVLKDEICHLTKELKTKEEQNKEVMEEYIELAERFVAVEQMAIKELKKESTPFTTKEEPTMKLLEVAQAHYQKFFKLIRRKKKNDE
ncbi:hypothetical protein J1N35_044620 [Gossypium stocksii]|uniref:Uncharacterized protein n=1 Tax=Gossypium stocksii TaxID=47602 RepID=A0A9D3U9V4_9ROSI|nr:hypothetical protein J1N35_044620 [Gossypium stocksii]